MMVPRRGPLLRLAGDAGRESETSVWVVVLSQVVSADMIRKSCSQET